MCQGFLEKDFFVSFLQKKLFPKTRSARPLYNIAAGLGSLLTCFAFFIFCVLIDSLTLKEKCQEKKNVQNSFTRLQLKSIYTAYRICPTGRIFYYPKIIGKHTTIFWNGFKKMIISKQVKTLLLLTFRNRADILLLRFQNGYRKSMRESLNLMRIVLNYFVLI